MTLLQAYTRIQRWLVRLICGVKTDQHLPTPVETKVVSAKKDVSKKEES